ncbi:MAG: class I SAM-dependent methyltransferase [Candidatus Krumholzibacteria bacterium]
MRLIVFLNKIFRRPGVEGRESATADGPLIQTSSKQAEAYCEWEYRWGKDLIAEYLEPSGDLAGKKVLDIGCGLGGKTAAYGAGGAAEILGVDLSLDNIAAGERFIRREPRDFRWGLFLGDAARLPLPDGIFDTVIANDAMEHFADPESAVREMARVTREGGAIWLFFTPHFSPLGSHLYDYIYTPWCHLVFRRRDLRSAIARILERRHPDRSKRAIESDMVRIMDSFDRDLNHMSIRRFFRIVRSFPELAVSFTELKPAKYRFLKVMTGIPLVREFFTGTVVCRLERRSQAV